MNEAIAEVIRGKTVLVIAHRLHSIVNADQICVLEQGTVADAGTHEELLGRCPAYQKALAGCGGQRPMGRESERRRGTMIQLMKRILAVSGRYKRRIQIALSFRS